MQNMPPLVPELIALIRERSILYAHDKGGTAKTTTASSLATELAKPSTNGEGEKEEGCRVLGVDLDSQADFTLISGIHLEETDYTVLDVLCHPEDGFAYAVKESPYGYYVLPATPDLSAAPTRLQQEPFKDIHLLWAFLVGEVWKYFDVIIIDTPGSFAIEMTNAAACSGSIEIPLQAEALAWEAVPRVKRHIDALKTRINPTLDIGGILCTLVRTGTRLSADVIRVARAQYGELVYQTVIPRSVKAEEAPSYRQPVTIYDPTSKAAVAYHRYAQEVRARYGFRPTVATNNEKEASHEGRA